MSARCGSDGAAIVEPTFRPEPDSDDEEPESEEDESNPYPLEGKYRDEQDKQE